MRESKNLNAHVHIINMQYLFYISRLGKFTQTYDIIVICSPEF
jgi:hypothetical protein